MEYEVVGFRRSVGTSKKTGKDFSGYIVFFNLEQSGVTGVATEQTFISDELGYVPALHDHVRLLYNGRGFLMEVEIL